MRMISTHFAIVILFIEVGYVNVAPFFLRAHFLDADAIDRRPANGVPRCKHGMRPHILLCGNIGGSLQRIFALHKRQLWLGAVYNYVRT